MKKIPYFFFLALMMAMVSCSPVKVVTNQDTSVDFSSYKTYNFLGWQDGSGFLP